MRIVVMGAGGVGGYFGSRLAKGGCEVAFVARGAHLAALREQGLHVRSQHGDIHLEKVEASDDPGDIGVDDRAVPAERDGGDGGRAILADPRQQAQLRFG